MISLPGASCYFLTGRNCIVTLEGGRWLKTFGREGGKRLGIVLRSKLLRRFSKGSREQSLILQKTTDLSISSLALSPSPYTEKGAGIVRRQADPGMLKTVKCQIFRSADNLEALPVADWVHRRTCLYAIIYGKISYPWPIILRTLYLHLIKIILHYRGCRGCHDAKFSDPSSVSSMSPFICATALPGRLGGSGGPFSSVSLFDAVDTIETFR